VATGGGGAAMGVSAVRVESGGGGVVESVGATLGSMAGTLGIAAGTAWGGQDGLFQGRGWFVEGRHPRKRGRRGEGGEAGWDGGGRGHGGMGEDVGELEEGGMGAVAEGCEWGGGGWVEEGMDEVTGGGGGGIEGGGCGHANMGGEPGEGVGVALRSGLIEPDPVAAVVVHGGAEIPTVEGVWRPGFSDSGFFVDLDSGARWGEGRAVVVEGAVELGLGGETGVDAGAAEEVEGDERLGKEAVPQVEGEVGVSGTEAGDEMIFERADGAFGGIAAVEVRGDQLVVDLVFLEELLEGGGSLIVESLELGAEAAGGEESVDAFVSRSMFGACAVFHGLGEDGVAVVVVYDEEVGVSGVGGTEEAAGLIGMELAGDGLAVSIDGVGAEH